MTKVFFKPWVGTDYKSGGIFGKKIMALGEAHTCGGCDECGIEFAKECEDMQTPDIIRSYLENHEGCWSRTYRKFERALVGSDTDNEMSRRIWESIAFYNYVQAAPSGPGIAPSPKDFEASEEAFFEVINELHPDVIIAWGKSRLYRNMPGKNWEPDEDIESDDLSAPTGYYTLDNGSRVRIIWIKSPSSSFTPTKWHRVLNLIGITPKH